MTVTPLAINYSIIGNLLLVGGGEVNKVYETRDFPMNIQAFMRDRLGERFLSFVHNRDTVAMLQGELVSRVGDANGITTITNILSGSKVLAVTTGMTPGLHESAILWVLDNDDAAGTAPENEMAFIKSNTATNINLDPDFPLTTALAVNDDLQLLSTYAVEAAAIADLSKTVMGVVISPDGLPVNKYGFVQNKGPCRALVKAGNALTVGQQMIADVKRVNAAGATSTYRLMIGSAKVSLLSDSVSSFCLVDMQCGPWAGSYSDQDAVV